ncbi:MAG: PilZ domain-containing protein [Candidatus Omnitrophica bacterium]|nr:PilZ domain-containing protein [Candidatus Omnitrophota bacterium]
MESYYRGCERREFARLPFSKPLAYKVCKKETLSMLLEGYTVNVSTAGLLCTLKDKVNLEDILWLSFDKSILIICSEMEKKSLIYQNGVIGKVVRINQGENENYDVGVKFITRVEKEAQAVNSRISHLKDEET